MHFKRDSWKWVLEDILSPNKGLKRILLCKSLHSRLQQKAIRLFWPSPVLPFLFTSFTTLSLLFPTSPLFPCFTSLPPNSPQSRSHQWLGLACKSPLPSAFYPYITPHYIKYIDILVCPTSLVFPPSFRLNLNADLQLLRSGT